MYGIILCKIIGIKGNGGILVNLAKNEYNNRIFRILLISIGVFALLSLLSAPVMAAVNGDGISDRISSISLIYGFVTVLSLFLLLGYCGLVRKKEI